MFELKEICMSTINDLKDTPNSPSKNELHEQPNTNESPQKNSNLTTIEASLLELTKRAIQSLGENNQTSQNNQCECENASAANVSPSVTTTPTENNPVTDENITPTPPSNITEKTE